MRASSAPFLAFALIAPSASAQNFAPPQLIAYPSATNDVQSGDLDGDGLIDVLSASWGDGKLAWYRNLGGGAFGGEKIITTSAAGSFRSGRVITTTADGVRSVQAADLNGDGDLDVVFITNHPDKVAWHENLGAGAFGPEQLLGTTSTDLRDLFVVDLDANGAPDVVTDEDISLSGFIAGEFDDCGPEFFKCRIFKGLNLILWDGSKLGAQEHVPNHFSVFRRSTELCEVLVGPNRSSNNMD